MNRADPSSRRPPRRPRLRTFWRELPVTLFVLIALGALVAFFLGDSFTLNILAATFLYAGLATSWNIIGGFGGQFSLGHSVFFAVGAYVTANLYLRLGVSPWLGLIPAAAVAATLAAVVSWPVFRLRGPFFAIATMALTEVVLALAIYFEHFTGGARRHLDPVPGGVLEHDLPRPLLLRAADARLSRGDARRSPRRSPAAGSATICRRARQRGRRHGVGHQTCCAPS